jgi:hypothetical protein
MLLNDCSENALTLSHAVNIVRPKMRHPLYKFIGYLSVKWLCIYGYLVLQGALLHWSVGSANAEGLSMLLAMLLILPMLEVILLYPLFRSALTKHGWPALLLLLSAFSLELLLSTFMLWQLTAGMLAKVAFSMILYGFFYWQGLCNACGPKFHRPSS